MSILKPSLTLEFRFVACSYVILYVRARGKEGSARNTCQNSSSEAQQVMQIQLREVQSEVRIKNAF